jgi:hypothetical protein
VKSIQLRGRDEDEVLMYPLHLATQNKSHECCDALLNTRSHTKVIRLYPNVLVAYLSVARKHIEKRGWKLTSCWVQARMKVEQIHFFV